LAYIASVYTREEIKNNPRLCVLLENPYIKDNMEIALSHREAELGGADEKRKFLESLIANGPELDTDTLMYYREKVLVDDDYYHIYITEIQNNYEYIDQIRKDRYGKNVDLTNCFTQPCNYLGPFSSSIGLIGDSNNFRTVSNMFSSLFSDDENKEEEKENDTAIWGQVKQHLWNRLVPDVQSAFSQINAYIEKSYTDFAKNIKDSGLGDIALSAGDPNAISRAEIVATPTKVNVFSKLGDCARMWEQMRRLNLYDPNQNKKGPIDAPVGKKTTDGTPTPTVEAITDNSLKP
jgi:hypothetical protein